MGKVLLYYKYITIEYPKRIVKWQHKICQELKLTGRILIGREGINGTVGGQTEAIELYKKIVHHHPLFKDMVFKESAGSAESFPRLQIKERDEIVRLGIDPELIKAQDGGIHLTPEQTHQILSNPDENVVLFDARNEYEWQIGAFENAIKPPIRYFRELPNYIDTNLEQFKDKKVVMYCTGGIRCERASAYLKSKNVAEQVYQMGGGIHTYIEQYPDGFFKGKNYVFDARIATKANEVILGTCTLCTTACDEYTNCLNAACNNHFICCDACKQQLQNTCSAACYDLVYIKQVPQRPQLQTVKVT